MACDMGHYSFISVNRTWVGVVLVLQGIDYPVDQLLPTLRPVTGEMLRDHLDTLLECLDTTVDVTLLRISNRPEFMFLDDDLGLD
jgi:hypothetical protein